MRKLSLMLASVLVGLLPGKVSLAQVAQVGPMPPATRLESFDTNIASVILKGTTEIGTLSGNTGIVSVKCREISDTATKEQGVVVEILQKGQVRDRLLIDYDEIASLLTAINYLRQLDASVTPLNAFDAEYTTKGGLKIAAFGTRRTGAIQFAIRDARTNQPSVLFPREDIARLGSLIDLAKAKLDSVRGG